MKSLILSLFSLVLIWTTPAVAHDKTDTHTLEISDAWARKTRRTTSAAVYLNIHNATDNADTLLAAETPMARMTSLHMSFEEDGVMRMEMQDSISLEAGGTVTFEPGGMHIMLVGLSEPLQEGSVFPLMLTFEQAGDVTVYVEVTGLSGPKAQ